MKRQRPVAVADATLARLIRDSSILDPHLKRQWLDVLPHLTPETRARLEAILKGEPEAGNEGAGRA